MPHKIKQEHFQAHFTVRIALLSKPSDGAAKRKRKLPILSLKSTDTKILNKLHTNFTNYIQDHMNKNIHHDSLTHPKDARLFIHTQINKRNTSY